MALPALIMAVFGFSGKDAGRIRATVNEVERSSKGGLPVNSRGTPGRDRKLGVLDGPLAYGATATVSIWELNAAGTDYEDSTINQTGVRCFLLAEDKQIPSGDRVHIEKVGGHWEVYAWQSCPEDV